ncbi:Ti-type conjugative transfer relaxase TraA [Sphingomonas koreensis]|jgi:Ti-type conjugative transfer relaxase TraA|uniref:Ti-type conjugative transfer relaxase TraA n=1 Tax=Sphingomonas koreensis TaxID=93064 RepID=A0A1L6JCJ9_9SPHN|nr:Ti-type conjugative transfer relaxase TraA [Sphingomonas koreensis]APR53671.1 Ti-type conjugative transfer relaxase TraA [Sphingomonas koreensis]RSU24197.1 Ti-type conjugative transfer relaxase TraA [Sphingomonas koreensis]RSU25900.1 Ti-type conjugative transfer relaxase TraA [Sphingomonas koreensis]RSU26046.1 Ti-type conjugative transfer relaxase TraA [Sphingomonas koreensis]RSU27937.1 Ti-type conjugative transfer relaxase TraA [Sphingomonas koreensis]
MAIYHFSVKVISRAAGRSAVAAAAYRSASRLHDERLDRDHDFTNKSGVVHSEILLPENAPEQIANREKLWNAVEAAEKRKDAQLSREVEFAIPRELDQAEGIRLARDFIEREFVERGMIADINVHWDVGADGEPKPHAHVMLTLRNVDENGFGKKNRDWNRTDLLEKWRERWAEHANKRLAELDIDARVDHRSLEAQGIELEPQHKIGPAAARMAEQGLASERLQEHHAIARANGEKLLANPALALDAITRTQATFTTRDLAMFVHRHSQGKDQFDRVMAAVRATPELVALGKDGRGQDRFTSRDMIETEKRLERATVRLEAGRTHGVVEQHRKLALVRAEMRGMVLSSEQRSAFDHVTKSQGLGVVIGYAGTGKSAMLGVAREAWESAGYSVRGVALSGIAAENLEGGSGIASRTIASMEHQWAQGCELLSNRDVLVIDEAGMIGSRQMERVLTEAEKRGAKVVLVGDPEQLQAIEAGAAFRATAERHGSIEITEIRRQREDWQRNATRYLATDRTGEAIRLYSRHDRIHFADTREQARADLIDRWDRNRLEAPSSSRIILTHTNDEVRELNTAARDRLRANGELGEDVMISTERGQREFAPGDRVMFLRNERSLGVKNGTLGQVQSVTQARMAVLLDDGRSIEFDVKDYANVDHGYAATVHKAQGVTVDRVHVLATPGLDRHAAYVALSRHRDSVNLHYGRDDFADGHALTRTLSRERGKDMASDYPAPERAQVPPPQHKRFAGLKLRVTPDAPELSPFERAVARVARSVADIVRVRTEGYAELPHQRAALDKAVAEVEALRPGVKHDLQKVFNADRTAIEEAAAGRPQHAIRATALEAEARTNPARRAEVFVARWSKLQKQSERAYVAGDMADRKAIRSEMAGMAKSLERDPQVESILAARKAQLGITIDTGRRLGPELAFNHGIDLGRGRGLGR